MEAQIQYDLFKEMSEVEVLRAELTALKDSHNAVRKRCFAELRGLQKIVMDQQNDIDFLRVKLGLACILEKSDRPLTPVEEFAQSVSK